MLPRGRFKGPTIISNHSELDAASHQHAWSNDQPPQQSNIAELFHRVKKGFGREMGGSRRDSSGRLKKKSEHI